MLSTAQFNNQSGFAAILMLVGVVALIAFLIIANAAPFKSGSLSTIYPKEESYAAGSYTTAFATYLGGSGEDQIRDIDTDSQGNIYVTGGTSSGNFPTTAGAFDTTYNTGSCADSGTNPKYDVFVAKFSPSGQLLWSTLLGGSCYDRAYALEVYESGGQTFVYVSGRAGQGFPMVSPLQSTFQGVNAGPYGLQNAFIAKLNPSATGASQVVWSTYVGTAELFRDIALDSAGNVYGIGGFKTSLGQALLPASWVNGSIQPNPGGGDDNLIVKVNANGTFSWATYFGGSTDEYASASIRVGPSGDLYFSSGTTSLNLTTTPNAYDRSHNGGYDQYVARLTADGKNLIFSTFVGGNGNDGNETHNLEVNSQGEAILAASTQSTNLVFPAGSFDLTFNGVGGSGTGVNTNYVGDGFVAKLSADGSQLLAGTYIGGIYGEGVEGVGLDNQGNISISGASFSPDFANSTCTGNKGKGDLMVVKFSSDLKQLLYCGFFGGSEFDYGRTSTADSSGNIYSAGHSASTNFPVVNPYLATNLGFDDGIIIKISQSALSPSPISTPSPSPTSSPIPSASFNPGDVNKSGKVDIFDYNDLLTHFGAKNQPGVIGDTDNDGDVDIFDYNNLITNFGK